MLVSVPYITPTEARINALFIQPSGWCARECFGCYTKGFTKEDLDPFLLTGFINSLVNPESKVSINQLTIAIDKLPADFNKASFMYSIFNAAINIRNKVENHITVHTVGDFLEYRQNQTVISNYLWGFDTEASIDKKFFNGPKDWPWFKVVSISHINPSDIFYLKRFRKFVTNHINWNLTIDPTVNLEKIKESFSTVAQEVDSIYLVLHKPSTGYRYNLEVLEKHQDFIRFIRTQSLDIQKKVNIDGCIKDSKKFLSTGYGCSSNISRFQIWPDGSVTGCPYNQTRITPPAFTIEGIIKNIYQASRHYEFNSCRIPEHLDPTNKRILLRDKPYLEIID